MKIIKAKNHQDYINIECLAKIIWREHFTPIIGAQQVEYMLQKFLSCQEMENNANHDHYEFYCMYDEDDLFGFISLHPETEMLFLSKLYIRKDKRGNSYSSKAVKFMEDLCTERNLKGIWLTCNKYNDHTLAIYKHLGFEIFEEAVNDIGQGYVMDDYYLKKMI